MSDRDDFDSLKPSKYFKTADVQDGPIVLTIAGFSQEEIGDNKEKLGVMSFEGEDKTMIVKSENLDILKELFGTKSNAVGKQVELFKTQTRFGGKKVDCMRLRTPGSTGTESKAPF